MKVSITDYEDYLYDHYKSHGIDTSLFMKLVEEVGEVATQKMAWLPICNDLLNR